MSVGKLERAGKVLISVLKVEGEYFPFFVMQRRIKRCNREGEMLCWIFILSGSRI